MREPRPFCWDRLHHLYIGILIVVIGYYTKNNIIILIGVFGIIDDIVEHTITADTPLRILYEQSIKESMPTCTCEQ